MKPKPHRASHRRGPRLATCLTAALALGACASNPSPNESGRDEAIVMASGELELVAVDLVSVMMQLPALSPFSTTVQVSPPPTAFGRTLVRTLRESGYGVQNVSADQGRHYVSYRRALDTAADGASLITYTMRVAAVEIEREYRHDSASRMVPESPVRVVGTEPTPIIVNDDLHRPRVGGGADYSSGVVFLDDENQVLARHERRAGSAEGAADERTLGERLSAERLLVLARANLFHADRLYAAEDELEDQRQPLWQVTLRFDDADSLLLGRANKRVLSRLRERFDDDTDRLSITGCSHGKSLLWDGTESQSLARSQRVKEELLLGGIPGDLMHEEGCFSTRYGDVLPPNAVLVTLERYPGAYLRAERQTSGRKG